jgi:hypothetical protein
MSILISIAHAIPWSNWALNQHADPRAILNATTTDDVSAVLRVAAEGGEKVKPIGKGHSFSPIDVVPGQAANLMLVLVPPSKLVFCASNYCAVFVF